jgi:tRNA threonylcarbamoyladenosine biosynthesis protein TsaB
VALQSSERTSFRKSDAQRQSAQRILPMITELLSEHKLMLDELDGISVMAGPGSFTGLRIGIAVAQGLSMTKNIPLIPVSNLVAKAAAVFRKLGETSPVDSAVICELAREGEVYFGAFQKSETSGVSLLGMEQVSLPENIIIPEEMANISQIAASGDAWTEDCPLHGQLAPHCELEIVSVETTLDDLLALANIKLGLNETVVGAELRPNYVKEELDYS